MEPSPASPAAAQAEPGRSQSDVVIDGIKDLITTDSLRAGSRLPAEKELAEKFKVSRNSLREGVRALAQMGVLKVRQGDGTYVSSLDPELLVAPIGLLSELQSSTNTAHLQSVRRVLECEAVSRAALLMTPEGLNEATTLLDGVEALLEKDAVDATAFMEADIGFHRLIAEASGNPPLAAFIDALAGRTLRTRMRRAATDRGSLLEAQREHRGILAELIAGDPARASIRMSNHLLGAESPVPPGSTGG